MSHSLLAADRRAHVRIVGVSLAAALAFVAALVASGAREPGSHVLVANAPAVAKAEKTTAFTSHDISRAVR